MKKCIKCGTDKKRIKGQGLCTTCYLRKWRLEHRERWLEIQMKHYRANRKTYLPKMRAYGKEFRYRNSWKTNIKVLWNRLIKKIKHLLKN